MLASGTVRSTSRITKKIMLSLFEVSGTVAELGIHDQTIGNYAGSYSRLRHLSWRQHPVKDVEIDLLTRRVWQRMVALPSHLC